MSALPLLLVTVFLNIAGFSLVLPLLPFYGTLYGASPFWSRACSRRIRWAAYSARSTGGAAPTSWVGVPCSS